MAYDFFTQPQGPAISVSLFQDAAESGIRQGAATPSAFTAAERGLVKGVEQGQQIQANDQQAQVRQGIIDQIPERQKALELENERKRLQLQTEQLNSVAQQATFDSNLLTAKSQAEAKAKLAQQNLEDISNTEELSPLIGSTDGAALNKVLTDPKYKGTLVRNADLASQILGTARVAPGVDPAIYKSANAAFTAIQTQKAMAAQAAYDQKLKAKAYQEHESKYQDALAVVETIPEVTALIKKGNYDPRKLELKPASEYETGPVGMGGALQRRDPPNPKYAGSYLTYNGVPLKEIYAGSDAKFAEQLQAYHLGKGLTGAYDVLNAQDDAAAASADAKQATEAQANGTVDRFGQTTPAEVAGNKNIIEDAASRNKLRFDAAQQKGVGSTYTALEQKGRQAVIRKSPPINPVTTPQNTPLPAGIPPVTQAVATPTPDAVSYKVPVTREDAQVHLSGLLGGADVQLNIETTKPPVNAATVQKVNAIPELKNKSAFLKGLISVESAGNPYAISSAGAAGLTQLMTGAASDVGLTAEDRFNAAKNIEGGEQYYNRLEGQIKNSYSAQGFSINPDPRVVLAAYNGGARHVQNAISAGNVTWPDIKAYLLANKRKGAGKENTEYPDKVIQASIPYIKGGNASDDAYVRSLINFGIIDVA